MPRVAPPATHGHRAPAVDVSVVLPVYNAEAFVADAVERLLGQSQPSIEIVVVDDGSSDGTGRVGASLAARHPQVRYLLQPENRGVAAARARGTAEARGRYVWFVDADDEWPDDAVARLLDAADASGADVVCAQARTVMLDGTVKPVGALPGTCSLSGTEAFTEFLRGRISGHLWNKMFSRDVLDRIAFTQTRQHSDQAMVAQALAKASHVEVIDAVVYRYLLRQGSIIRSSNRRADSLRTVGQVVRDCAAELGPEVSEGRAMRYYSARFSLLSRMKDAVTGAYEDAQRRALVREIRADLSPRIQVAPLREGDPKRTGMLLAARWSLPVFRAMIVREGARG